MPPTPTEKILENEDKLTADGYRKQLETNYALKLPPEQVTPFIDARFNIKGSAEYPRWLRAFVSSAQMIYREPVVHEIPLITQPTLFVMGADDHNAPGRANAPEALRSKMGQNAERAKALAAAGATTIDAVITHALFPEELGREMFGSGIRSIRSTHTVPHPTNAIRLDDLFANVLEREMKFATLPETSP